MLVDSHCHIEMADFDADRSEMLKRAEGAGVVRILCIGTGDWRKQSMSRAGNLAEQFDFIDTSVGIHPHDAALYDSAVESEILKFADRSKVVGWGEIGLDYHYNHADQETQLRVFRRQTDLARELELPVIVHSRDAEEDTIRVLREANRMPLAGVMHCYGGSRDTARRCIDLGFFISFAGNVTFNKATNLQDVARDIPLDWLLIETDAPYLSPVPLRGKRNEPAHVKHTAQFLAELRSEPRKLIEEATARNYFRLFHEQSNGWKKLL